MLSCRNGRTHAQSQPLKSFQIITLEFIFPASVTKQISNIFICLVFFYLCGSRNLKFRFLRGFDNDHSLVLEGPESADVLMSHVGHRAGEVKETHIYNCFIHIQVLLESHLKGYAEFSVSSVMSNSCWAQLLMRVSSVSSTTFRLSSPPLNLSWFFNRKLEMGLPPLNRF